MSSIFNKKKELACPICDSAMNLWVVLPNGILYRCPSCEHCLTDTESIDQVELYGSNYYLETHRNSFENPNFSLFDQLRFKIVNHGATSLLDVGCGNGAFLKYMQNAVTGITLTGIDLSEVDTKEQIIFVSGDFLRFDFKQKFDVIVSLAVIEHLTDVCLFIRRCHELLNTNGKAFIMTLNEKSLLYEIAKLLRRIEVTSPFVRLYDVHHINHFSQKSLIHLLTKDGLFKVDTIINHNTSLSAIDLPGKNCITQHIMKIGVAIIFFIGRIINKTYLQTIVI
ncbi:MAG: class I SAM-dependent methyltransferase, partial [Chlorobium sp.]|nr:class I SAM-dependent methyltransferase [Chlorobium sp.]